MDAEGKEVVGPWVKEQAVGYPILLGSESLARDFGALGFPTLVVVRPDGKIDSLHVGLIELADLVFAELRRRIGITQKELTRHLRRLEAATIVTRTVHAEVPPRVEYALTDLGRTLVPPLVGLACWAWDNRAIFETDEGKSVSE